MKKNRLYGYALLMLLGSMCYAKDDKHIPEQDTKSIAINQAVVLDLTPLRIVDGKSFGINPKLIHAKLVVRTQILHMLHGTSKNGTREGLYTFNDVKYTVTQLAELEAKTKLDASWIKKVKQEFTQQIKPFLDLGRGFKPQMLIFISESLRLHHRDLRNSVLLKWAETDDDMQAFNVHVHTFHDLCEFLYELLNFLDDLISSCPKAKQLFLDGLKTEREKIMYAQRFDQLLEQQLAKINKYNK